MKINEREIKLAKTGKNMTSTIANMENDIEIRVTRDAGMSAQYCRQLGGDLTWVSGGQRIFKSFDDMLKFATFFGPDGMPNSNRPATDTQISYLIKLNVKIEDGMTVARASQLIDAAKNSILGSVNGWYTDGSN